MKILELAKQLSVSDLIVMVLDEKGLSDSDIASVMEINPSTIHNIKKKHSELLVALKSVKTEPVEYGNKDVNKVINTFVESFGVTKTTKWDRFAAKRLSDKYTANKISEVIVALSAVQGEKFAPSVRSVSQFEEKLPNIISYFKKRTNDQVINL